MVRINYKPYKEIVINEIIKHNLQDFIALKSNKKNAFARWVDGILFEIGMPTPTPETIHDQIKEGIIYWGSVEFAEMDQYVNILTNPTNQNQIQIINNSNNTSFITFINWLKKQKQWFES